VAGRGRTPVTDFPAGFRGRDRYGEYEVVAVDGDYRLVRYQDGREERRSLATLRLAHRNREYDHSRPPPAPPAPPKARPAARPAPQRRREELSFRSDETEPLIAGLIRDLAGDPPAYVPQDTLATALLADTRGRRLIARARELQGDDRPPAAIAAAMLASFGRRFTGGDSPYARRFKRKKVDGAWAYRPEVGARD